MTETAIAPTPETMEMPTPVKTKEAMGKKAKLKSSKDIQVELVDAYCNLPDRRAGTYPTLRQLFDIIGEEANSKEGKQAANGRHLGKHLVIPAKSTSGSTQILSCPVCLVEEIQHFAESDVLIAFAFQMAQTGKARAFSASQLSSKLRSSHQLQKVFAKALRQHLANSTLPSDYCWVQGMHSELLFQSNSINLGSSEKAKPQATVVTTTPEVSLTERPQPTAQTTPPQPTVSSNTFARDFDDAFEQIDRENGLTNFVKLFDLRRALTHYSREEFDHSINPLRRARQFTLNSSDGNYVKLSQEERDAGIREDTSLLVYCSRIRS